ncbi:DUF6894 family protein [Bradyrhizobium sp. Ce-3]|uniref:DUF6894 family protein n=1 Tax=Bradyrhizobium sp. Ce-3 TaxID=2913970 RepID=UPI001FB865A5|nr:hypothetical protein [Bradyrhizobium sp. Ce-3]GKQ50831.1 hypothetical protein BRSPCE3_16860 [Bradyrhizobium sp. Ce-3]
MAQFFFDLQEDGSVLLDREGVDLADAQQAELKAWQTACDIAKDNAGQRSRSIKILVRDQHAEILAVELNATVLAKR